MTTFGVDFTAHIKETHTDIPHLIRKCTAEIDRRGLHVKVNSYLVLRSKLSFSYSLIELLQKISKIQKVFKSITLVSVFLFRVSTDCQA